MKRKLIVANTILAILASTQILAAGPIQRIDVLNMLWNKNATDKVQGLTPTQVVVAFNNGGPKPCFTSTLNYQGAATVYAGVGQPCVNAISSVTITPVAGAAGLVYSAPSAYNINVSHFSTQMIIDNGIDPLFDSTNGAVKTPGTVEVIAQGQFAQN